MPITVLSNSRPKIRHIADLSPPARLVLVTLRQRHQGRSCWPALCGVYFGACGISGVEDALLGFEGVIDVLLSQAKPLLRPLNARTVAPAEHMVLDLIAALQEDQSDKAFALAHRLVPAYAVEQLVVQAKLFATALRRSDQILRRRNDTKDDRSCVSAEPGTFRELVTGF
ncbi:MAG: hypothetical protein OEU36_12590 [Gammaproteobacteria bacterium]|nr:hypothetical protein [Gammaproteobacteria bacterium]